MRDKTITKIIATTHLSIVSFFIFMVALFTGLFIVLQNGLYLDNVSISNIHAKNIYIKWDKSLNVSMQELEIDTKSNKTNITYKEINKLFQVISQTTNWFHSIIIHKLQINNISGSFEYTNDNQGFLTLNSPTLNLKSKIYFQSHLLKVAIDNFTDKQKDLWAKGIVIFNTDTKNIYTKIDLDIHNDANLTFYSMADSHRLIYNIYSNKNISDISYLIKMAHLPKEVIYWAYTAVKMHYLDIQKFHGFIDYNDIQNAYKNIYIKAVAEKLNYRYNPKLHAIQSKQTNLTFKRGVLYIKPQNASTYNMNLGKSRLKIDFTKKDELLTLHLLFDGILNKDMLQVLNIYHVKLPFLQNKGIVTTDLTLKVDLETIAVDAKGDFYTKKANFDYLGLNLDIYDTHIHLDNYDVTIDKMKVQYKDIAQADVQVTYDAKKSAGTINFDFHKIQMHGLSLITDKTPLHITYNINPKQDTIAIEKSQWRYKNKQVTLDKLLVDFDLKRLKAKIPVTFFKIDKIANGYVNGVIDLKTAQMNLDLDLLTLKYDGVKLSQTNLPLHIKYDKFLYVTPATDIYFSVNGTDCKAKNASISFEKGNLYLKHTLLKIGQYISTKIDADYHLTSKKAHISLNDFILKNPNTGKILYQNNKIIVGGYIDGENIIINSKELAATFISNSKQWKLTLNSLATIARKSHFLEKYKLNKGEISFYKKSDALYTHFNADIDYPYYFLVNKNKKIRYYNITGYITKEYKTYLTVNKNINIVVDKDIKINMHDTGVNVDAIVDFTKKIAKSHTGKSDLKLSVDTTNSYLYIGHNRYVISDVIHLQYYDNILTAQLIYENGKARFKLENNQFHLYGKNFNDKFMENLFVLSKFSGGSLDFSMDGSLDDYKGIFYMRDTTMIDYKLLNNVLAFIDTIPSLATFSLPGYSKKGLHVKNAYLKFRAKKGIFQVSDIYLKSKELKILGKGSADINKNSIDLILDLKTALGSKLSKVPLVGYIVFDGKNIATTLKITGKLSDPKVSTTIAKDIIVAPVNIIKRTLTSPFKILQKLF